MSRIGKCFYWIGIVFLNIVVTGFLIEAFLWVKQENPWAVVPRGFKEPVIFEKDPVRGWRNKEGRYQFPDGSGGYVPMVFNRDGSRNSGPHISPDLFRLVFVGCSFTQGRGIRDEDTFPWKIQQRYPHAKVLNWGVGGYSTYQSLLVLEDYFLRERPSIPQVVVYGFSTFHEERNVWGRWVKFLSARAEREGVALPYCSLGQQGRLQRHPPKNIRRGRSRISPGPSINWQICSFRFGRGPICYKRGA